MKRAFRLLLLLLILSLIFSIGYQALESMHDCHGEDCPVCKVIAVLSCFFGVAVLPSLFFVIRRRMKSAEDLSERDAEDPVTLVRLKVKMSD
ncbi:MAG: hypothetical protein J6Y74_01305 [Clostridia bacterium]|nr:hypothetical protein [Clostridia bacterium]